MAIRDSFLAGLTAVVLAGGLVAAPAQTLAQGGSQGGSGNSRGPVHETPPDDDPSYRLMGEFTGKIEPGDDQPAVSLALQIRPLGHGEFQTLAYYGGLPGEPQHQPESIRMIGQLSGDFLILSGGPWAVLVETDHCTVISRAGQPIGRLERVTRRSPTLGAKPPAEAIVLFDGSNTDQFVGGQMTDDRLLKEGPDVWPMIQDFDLHLEFRLPYMPQARDQQRANSGLYIHSRYECQILDSFGELPVFNGVGSLYRFRAPDLNMALPPLTWQTYDIRFTAARWAADGSKLQPARITSWLNGVIVQNDVALPGPTGAGKEESPTLLPSRLQDHSDPVRFRNIWIIDRGLAPTANFPIDGDGQWEPAVPPPAELTEPPAEPASPEDTSPDDTASDGDATDDNAGDAAATVNE